MKILSHDALVSAIETSEISFSPDINQDQIGETSVSLRLGEVILDTDDRQRVDRWCEQYSESGCLFMVGKMGDSALLALSPGEGSVEVQPGEEIWLGNDPVYESITFPPGIIARLDLRGAYRDAGFIMDDPSSLWIEAGWTGPIKGLGELLVRGSSKIDLCPGVDQLFEVTFFRVSS